MAVKWPVLGALLFSLLFSALTKAAEEANITCPSISTVSSKWENLDSVSKFSLKPISNKGYLFNVYSRFNPFYDFQSKLWWTLDVGVESFDFNSAINLAQEQIKNITSLDRENQEHAERWDNSYYCAYSLNNEELAVELHAYDSQQHTSSISERNFLPKKFKVN